ncbi:MAG: hypothetical protein GWO24_33825, partial [Akkermansiaceae bacterium]|nr:hypothetical protein [Akkermansiaceae bacterium]
MFRGAFPSALTLAALVLSACSAVKPPAVATVAASTPAAVEQVTVGKTAVERLTFKVDADHSLG